jgi:hypothetical protein
LALAGLHRIAESRLAALDFTHLNPYHPQALAVVRFLESCTDSELDESLQTALHRPELDASSRTRLLTLSVFTSTRLGDVSRAARNLSELFNSQLGVEEVPLLAAMVTVFHQTGQMALIKNLVTLAGDLPQLFPLRRALEYLDTHDRDLIEKLSPEVRGVVEDIVTRLKAPQEKQGRS